MSDEEILSLPVTYLAHDSYLLLWVTNNFLPIGFQCLERWGFEYKAIHTWLKTTAKGTPHIGVGHYGRNCTEQLIVATKGNVKSWTSLGIRDVPNIILARRGRHSEKPKEFDLVCDRLLAALGGKGIELFARRQRDGWDCWGLEANKSFD
jgi:N6-adenosine-specific RNA methylase IME4